MNVRALLEAYAPTVTDAGAVPLLESWVSSLGLFPPDVGDLAAGDGLRGLPETRRAVADMFRWGLAAGLLEADPFAGGLEAGGPVSFAAIAAAFVDHSRRHHKGGARTAAWYADTLNKFAQRWPGLEVDALKPFHVQTWLDKRFRQTQIASIRQSIARIQAALNWAAGQGLIKCNPLAAAAALKLRKMPRRRVAVSGNDHEILFSNIPDENLRDFVTALHDSGARPGEVARVEASAVDLAAATWTLEEHKTAEKTDRPRVIYLSPRLLELSGRLAARWPAGPIFRNSRGNPWRPALIAQRFRVIRRRLGLGPIVPYSYRHAYATDLLALGFGPATVAELLGHSSLQMLSEHYAHLGQLTDHLRDAAAARSEFPEIGDAGGGGLKIWS